MGCTGLINVTLPDNVKFIGNRTFKDCTGLKSVTYFSTTEIGRGAIPAKVKKIIIKPKKTGDFIYYVNQDGKTVAISKFTNKETETAEAPAEIEGLPVTCIGKNAFEELIRLMDVTLPAGLKSINERAFYHCINLTNINLPASLAIIGEGAFINCFGLTDIKFPDSLSKIAKDAFLNCKNLTDIGIPAGVTEIGLSAFEGCEGLKSITVDKNNKKYASIDGVLFDKDLKTLIKYPDNGAPEYTVPDGVTSINESAFYKCKKLTDINLPAGLTKIEKCGFFLCESLKNINLPAGLTSIGDSAFLGCKSLKDIDFPDSLTSIGAEAFKECTSLTSLTLP
jgi:hypothetical protein